MDGWMKNHDGADVLALGSALGDGAGVMVGVYGSSWWVCEVSPDGFILQSGTDEGRWAARRAGLCWAIEYLDAAIREAQRLIDREYYYMDRPHLRPEGD